MKQNVIEEKNNDALTEADFREFLSATGDEQWELLLAHAERNQTAVKARRLDAAGKDNMLTVETTEE